VAESRARARELPPVAAAYVVVPAHDEQERIGPCLTSVRRAAAAVIAAHPGLRVGVVVVLDRCADATPALVAAHGTRAIETVEIVEVDVGCVGAARRAGVDRVAALTTDLDAASVLVANTDADCVVPTAWLMEHVRLAGVHHLVQGEVVPDPREMTAEAGAAWSLRNPAGRGSLHGANLSFRLGAHLAAGGFPAVPDQEDLLMVRAMKAAGATSTGGTSVVTSARREGRVGAGFAAYLRDLDAELADLPRSTPGGGR